MIHHGMILYPIPNMSVGQNEWTIYNFIQVLFQMFSYFMVWKVPR